MSAKKNMKSNKINRPFFFTLIFFSAVLGVLASSQKRYLGTTFSSYSSDSINFQNKEKSLAAFDTILTVIKSPRCMNCHPLNDRPRQGDDQKIHALNVQRGAFDTGTEVQKCATCHHEENNPYTQIPGAPHWQLAPKSMGWYGLSDFEIASRLVDTTLNGGRTPEELVHHMSHDALVLWAWEPGGDRKPPSIAFEDFKTALQNWLLNGALIPEK
jgi:(2Fe-2S) ferredoxin